MFINPNELDSRLEKGKIQAPKALNRSGNGTGKHGNNFLKIIPNRPGKSEGDLNLPDEVRATVGIFSRISGIKNTEKAFDLSTTTVQNAKFGAVNGGRQIDAVVDKIESALAPVREAAIAKALMAIDNITEEKLKSGNANQLAGIASTLSNVIKNTVVGRTDDRAIQAVQIIHSVPQKAELPYETIELQ